MKKNDTKNFIERSLIIHNGLYGYNKTEYIKSTDKVLNNCPNCLLSKGELLVEKILIMEKINFIKQMKFEKCVHKKMLMFDFYLPDYNICIEFNGLQHYKPIKIFGGEDNLKIINIPYKDMANVETIIKNNLI